MRGAGEVVRMLSFPTNGQAGSGGVWEGWGAQGSSEAGGNRGRRAAQAEGQRTLITRTAQGLPGRVPGEARISRARGVTGRIGRAQPSSPSYAGERGAKGR